MGSSSATRILRGVLTARILPEGRMKEREFRVTIGWLTCHPVLAVRHWCMRGASAKNSGAAIPRLQFPGGAPPFPPTLPWATSPAQILKGIPMSHKLLTVAASVLLTFSASVAMVPAASAAPATGKTPVSSLEPPLCRVIRIPLVCG